MAEGFARLVVGRDPARTLRRALLLTLVAWLVINYGILPVRGVGPSMDPTMMEGDLRIVNRVSYALRAPRRGEVVAVRLAGERAVLVKRIIAGPGDRLSIRDGVVERNGVALDEPYVVHRAPWNLGEQVLGADQYFVVGDNRSMRMELHTMGTVAGARLVGPLLWE